MIKIASIFIIYVKFILTDFNFDNSLKSNMRKLLNSINEHLINIIDNFIIPQYGLSDGKLFRDFLDKYQRVLKNHKIKKNKDIGVYSNTIYKNLDMACNNVKQFSNNYFKIGYFKPIHSICFDLFRLLESFTVQSLASAIINNILFYPINNTLLEKKLRLYQISN